MEALLQGLLPCLLLEDCTFEIHTFQGKSKCSGIYLNDCANIVTGFQMIGVLS